MDTKYINLYDYWSIRFFTDVFQFDSDYKFNEERSKTIRKEILGDSDADSKDESGSEAESDEEEETAPAGTAAEPMIVDNVETNLVALRPTIYLTIQSSLDFELGINSKG